MSLYNFLIYDNIYNDYESVNPFKLIIEIPSDSILMLISRLNCILWSRENDKETQNILLYGLIDQFNPESKKNILQMFEANPQYEKYIIFNNISNLIYISFCLSNFNSKERDLNSKDYENIFKVFLYINQFYNNIINKIESDIENADPLSLSLALGFAQNDFISTNMNHRTYLAKGFYFFNFIQKDSKLKNFLSNYLKSRNIHDYKFLLFHLANIYIRYSNHSERNIENIEYKLIIEQNLKSIISFIKNMSIDQYLSQSQLDRLKIDFERIESNDLDFKIIRNYPLFQFDNNKFYFLSINFFGDKLYSNLKFDFKDYIEKTSEYNKQPFDILSHLGHEFTEKFLLAHFLYSIFHEFSNYQKEGRNNQSESEEYGDYYIRIGNKVLLFECKDSIIRANVKYSYESDKIKELLINKFCGKEQGLIQIINVIDRFSNNKIRIDQYFLDNKEKIEIYPVFIYTDSILETNGVNYFINTQFNKMKEGIVYPFVVNNLIMINLDFFINYRSFISKHVRQFLKVLELYSEQLNIELEVNLPFNPSYIFPTFEERFKTYLPKELDNINNLRDIEIEYIVNEIQDSKNKNHFS